MNFIWSLFKIYNNDVFYLNLWLNIYFLKYFCKYPRVAVDTRGYEKNRRVPA